MANTAAKAVLSTPTKNGVQSFAPIQRAAIPQKIPRPNNSTVIERITSHETKMLLNYAANGGASVFNLLTFLNGNFHFFDGIQEKLEKFGEIMSRIATGTQGLVLAADTWKTENLIPFFGFLLEIPIAMFTSGNDLWLRRGVPQALGQLYRIIDQREIVDKNGEPILKNGKAQVIEGDFSEHGNKLGWWKGFTTTCREMPKLVKEVIDKPSRIHKLTHSLFLASIFQTTGTVLAMFGSVLIGAGIRDAAGVLCDYALMRDENLQNTTSGNIPETQVNKKRGLLGFNFDSVIVRSGIVFTLAAIVDFAKRFQYFFDKINNLTEFSLFFDRGAALMYTIGNLGIKSEGHT